MAPIVNASKLLREKIFEYRLRNGLRVALVPKRKMVRKVALLATEYGSIDVEFRRAGDGFIVSTPPGVAHFLEHQIFKKEDKDALMEFGKYGASSNAFTSQCSTEYYFACTEHFESNLDLLLQLVYSPFFSEQFVAKEKLIIEQELRMYNDMPDHRCFVNLMNSMYHRHPVRLEIGGTVETIQGITKDVLQDCYRTFYSPKNMVLTIVGDIDPDKVADETARLMERLPLVGENGDSFRRWIPDESPKVGLPFVKEEMAVSRPRVAIGFKESIEVEDGEEMVLMELLMDTILDLTLGKGTAAYDRMYRSGLIDDSFSFSYIREKSFGFTVFAGETDSPELLRDTIVDILTKRAKRGFGAGDIERIGRRRLGRYVRAFDSPDEIASLCSECVMKKIDPFSFPGTLKKVTAKKLTDHLRNCFSPETCATSIIAPH